MSLVRSSALFGSHERYTMADDNDISSLAKSVFDSDNHGVIYPGESYGTDIYDSQYFFQSPNEELICSDDLFIPSLVSSGEHAYEISSVSEFGYSPSADAIDFDEDKMRLKFQELEEALLDSHAADKSDKENGYSCMEIDDEWFEAIQLYTGRHESPNESSSTGSNLSQISCSKEISVNTSRTPKSLLFECAAAIHCGKYEEASCMINVLRQRVSIQGDPSERIAAYMVEALVARMATSGKGLYKALKCKEAPSLDRLSAMQVLFEVCPCFRFGFMVANGAILEAFRDEDTVHIIDFDINQGSQYYTLLKAMSEIPGKHPHLRLTGVDDPDSVQRAVGGLEVIGQRLELLAEDLQLSFKFHTVAAETGLVSPSMLDCRPGEALVVNFAFQLHHMPDESVSTINLRDQLLRMVKGLNPKLVTVVEQDVNTNTTPFLTRFADAYSYYAAVFESLDAALTRDSQNRMNVEKQCLARDIINVVACEGEERIERYEVAGKWRARMNMAGFHSRPISQNVTNEIQKLIKQYSEKYTVKEEIGALHFGWEGKILVVSSSWSLY